MYAVVSLLDDKHCELIESLWAELEREFDIRGIYAMCFPHFSYQIAEYYDIGLVESILRPFALNQGEFRVKTAGLGIFTSIHPVLSIPIVRTLEVSQFHQALWQEISRAGSGVKEYYHPDKWVPHITLTQGDILKDIFPEVVRFLSKREFNWEITVNNISLICDTGGEPELRFRSDFGGRKSQS